MAGRSQVRTGKIKREAKTSMAVHVKAMLEFHRQGIPVFDYGNNIRQMAKDEGVSNAFDFPGFVPAYIRPLFCRGVGPFRWVALSGDPEDIYKTDQKVKELIPERSSSLPTRTWYPNGRPGKNLMSWTVRDS